MIKNYDENIKMVTKRVAEEVYPNWSLNQKIRFVYLRLGLYLEKNTDFFLNSKLSKYGYSKEEISKIYNDDQIFVSDRNKQYQVICKSAALFLKLTFDKLGIENSFIHTVEKVDDIFHWFLVAKGDDEEQFFLTLAADLPFIKNNFPTEHFANNIDCLQINKIINDEKETSKNKLINKLNELNSPLSEYVYYQIEFNHILLIRKSDIDLLSFKILDGDMKFHDLNEELLNNMQDNINIDFLDRYYEIDDVEKNIIRTKSQKKIGNITIEYDEIKHTSLLKDKERLKQIDHSIGYNGMYDLEKFINDANYEELYWTMSEEDSEIYEIYRKSLNIGDDFSKAIDEVTMEESENFKKNIEKYILLKINEIKNTNYNSLIECLGSILEIEENELENITINEILKKYKKIIKNIKDIDKKDIIVLVQSVVNVEEKLFNFVNAKKKLYEFDGKECIDANDLNKQYSVLIEEYNNAKKEISTKFGQILKRISYFFIKDKLDINSKMISTECIIRKFQKMFPVVFNCNFENEIFTGFTEFSRQGYSEQIILIKKFLKEIFPELTENNCSQVTDYKKCYSPVENRIRCYPLRNKETKEYCIGFSFVKLKDEDFDADDSYIYIPSGNCLRKIDRFGDRRTYLTVSNSLIPKIDELENNRQK